MTCCGGSSTCAARARHRTNVYRRRSSWSHRSGIGMGDGRSRHNIPERCSSRWMSAKAAKAAGTRCVLYECCVGIQPRISHARRIAMGRVALVTGASSGLGRVMALGLLEAGHRVVLSATDRTALEDTRQASRAGDRAAVITADLSRQSEIPSLARAAEEAFGQIDILVNNAGVPRTPARHPHEVELQ